MKISEIHSDLPTPDRKLNDCYFFVKFYRNVTLLRSRNEIFIFRHVLHIF